MAQNQFDPNMLNSLLNNIDPNMISNMLNNIDPNQLSSMINNVQNPNNNNKEAKENNSPPVQNNVPPRRPSNGYGNGQDIYSILSNMQRQNGQRQNGPNMNQPNINSLLSNLMQGMQGPPGGFNQNQGFMPSQPPPMNGGFNPQGPPPNINFNRPPFRQQGPAGLPNILSMLSGGGRGGRGGMGNIMNLLGGQGINPMQMLMRFMGRR